MSKFYLYKKKKNLESFLVFLKNTFSPPLLLWSGAGLCLEHQPTANTLIISVCFLNKDYLTWQLQDVWLGIEQDKYIRSKHTHSTSFVLVKLAWNLIWQDSKE